MAEESDDFNRSLSNNLGTGWSEVESEVTVLAIRTNALRMQSSGGGKRGFAFRDTVFGNNQFSEAEYVSDNLFGPFAGPAVRIDPASTLTNFTGYAIIIFATGYQIFKWVNATIADDTERVDIGTPVFTPIVAGEVVRLEASGTTLRVLIDGVEKISETDSDIAGGRVGFLQEGRTVAGDTVMDNFLGGDGTPDLQVQESLILGEQPQKPLVFGPEFLDAGDALTLAETPLKPAAFDFEELPDSLEAMTLGEEPLKPAATGIKVLTATENFSLAEDPEFLKGPEFSPLSLVLAEIRVDQGTRFAAGKPVRHPSRYYKALIVSAGRITRSIPVPASIPQVGDAVLELADVDGALRRIFSETPPQNRPVILKVGPEGESERLFHVAYTGQIVHVNFPPGLARITLRDLTWQFLDEDSPNVLTAQLFGNDALFAENLRKRTEGSHKEPEVFAPVAFGIVDASLGDGLGAVNAIRINPTRFSLSQHPVPHAPLKIFIKTGGGDFAAATGFAIVEEEKTIQGLELTYTHVDFDAAQPDDAEVRWSGEGATDDGTKDGAVERNPVECIRIYLERVVGKSPGELNSAVFQDVAAIVAAVETGSSVTGLMCDGVIEARMTHGEALTRMLKSFGLVLFTDKRGLISIRYIAAPFGDRPTLDDVQDIHLETDEHDLGRPVLNVYNAKYARLYGSQKWGVEVERRDEDSIDGFGRAVPIDFPMWFVRETPTAEVVVQDAMGWTAPESFRMKIQVPGHRRTPLIELGQEIGLTSYSGLEPGVGGYKDKTFLVHRTEFDLDTLDLIVHGITRTEPQAGQGAVVGNVTMDARFGPFYRATGNFYAALRDESANGTLHVQGSQDWGQHWAKQDAANAPSYGSEILAHDAVVDRFDSNKLLVVTQIAAAGTVDYHRFDLKSRTWDFIKRNVWPGASPFDNEGFQFMAQIERSRKIGRLGVFFFRESDPDVSGGGGGVRGRHAWSYSDDEGLGWTGPADVGQDTDVIAVRGNSLYDYRGGRIVAGADDRFHFWYTRLLGDFTANTPDQFHRTAKSDGGLTNEVKWHQSSLSFFPAPFNVGIVATFTDEDGDLAMRVPFKRSFGRYVQAKSLDTMSDQLNWQGFNDKILNQGSSDNFANYVMAAIQESPSVPLSFHFMGAIHLGLSSQKSWSFHKVGVSADGDDRIGPKYSTTLTLQNAGFLVLRLGGRDWIATIQEAATSSYDFYFTLWPVADLPRPESFTTDSIEELIDF
jgi:hypothetical protein